MMSRLGRAAVAGAAILWLTFAAAGAVRADDSVPPATETEATAASSGTAAGDATTHETATDEPAATRESDSPEEPEPSKSLRDRLDELPFSLAGFLDARAGVRTMRDPDEKAASLAELRLQLDAEKDFDNGSVLKIKTDFLYDPVPERDSLNLILGHGWLDLREANYTFSPMDFMDVKAGRQILTWGTGDLVFLNDMFPKDWVSFFSGRDVEYLKAPSDAVKVSTFTDVVNFDVVYTPRFNPDRYISGDRLSYYNPMVGERTGQYLRTDIPDDCFSDSEEAWRFYKNVKGYELAMYGYYGFWKSPSGFNYQGKATFPDLSTYGWSVRGPLAKGIVNFEMAYYDSRDDQDGDDPTVPNSQMRGLVGYTQDLAKDLTLGVQYYIEHMMDFQEYRGSVKAIGMPVTQDCDRQVLTFRLTRLLMNQNLSLGLFAYYSPTDDDTYLRPHASYRISDNWSAEVGANFFFGNRDYTFFNQFELDSNVYAGVRYSF